MGRLPLLGNPRSIVALLTIVYLILIWLSYDRLISPWFGYLGYSAEPVAPDVRGYCVALGLVPLAWMPLDIDRTTKLVYWLIYLFVIAPAAVISPVVLATGSSWWLVQYATVILGFGIVGAGYSIPLDSVPILRLRIPRYAFWAGIIGLSVVNYGSVYLQFGAGLRLDLLTKLLSSELSEARLEARATFESSRFAFSGYGLAWQSGVVNPFLIAFGTVHRMPAFLVAGLLGQLVLFSVAAGKSILISSLIVWMCVYLLRERRRESAVPRLITIISGLVVIGGVHQLMTGAFGLNSILVRRALMTPAVLSRYYFDFFSTHPKTRLSQSVLGGFFDYPYGNTVPRTVGATYVSGDTSANANFFADAFANFGITGVMLFALLLAALFVFIDANTRRTEILLSTATFVIPGSSLVNSALLTSMLTHGILLSALVLLALDGLDVHSETMVEQGPFSKPIVASAL